MVHVNQKRMINICYGNAMMATKFHYNSMTMEE